MAILDNLLGYYKLNQGVLVDDSSGNSKPLTNNNSVAEASDGKFGYCADWGTTYTAGKTLTRADALSIGTGNFSFNMWVKYNSLPASGTLQAICGIFVNGTKTQHLVDYRNVGSLKYDLWTGSTGGTETSYSIDESTNTYYMLTLTYDSSNLRLYRNTSLIATQGTGSNTTSSTTGIIFGNGIWGDDRQLKGKLDEIPIWGRVITSDEISTLYNGGSGYELPIATANTTNFFQVL